MVFVAILAILLVAVAVGCAVAVVTEPRVRRAERLRLIDVYGYVAASDAGAEVAPARQTLDMIAGVIGDFFASRLSSLREEEVQRRLIAAGFWENFVQALVQGVFAGPASTYLFTRSVVLLGAGLGTIAGWGRWRGRRDPRAA